MRIFDPPCTTSIIFKGASSPTSQLSNLIIKWNVKYKHQIETKPKETTFINFLNLASFLEKFLKIYKYES